MESIYFKKAICFPSFDFLLNSVTNWRFKIQKSCWYLKNDYKCFFKKGKLWNYQTQRFNWNSNYYVASYMTKPPSLLQKVVDEYIFMVTKPNIFVCDKVQFFVPWLVKL